MEVENCPSAGGGREWNPPKFTFLGSSPSQAEATGKQQKPTLGNRGERLKIEVGKRELKEERLENTAGIARGFGGASWGSGRLGQRLGWEGSESLLTEKRLGNIC